MRIIDDHIHCGNNKRTKVFTPEDIRKDLAEANAQGAVIFAFPEDIYRIECTKVSKNTDDIILYPFYFVWNDYIMPDNLSDYAGIKWHRHWDEPKYDYDDPKCYAMLKAIKDLSLPVVLEEEFEYTVRFVKENPEINVIIPHIGFLNGGYDKMPAFFDKPNVYFDTGTAKLEVIKSVLDNIGVERMIFGSDVSGTSVPFFNYTKVELDKVIQLNLDENSMSLIFAGNIERLIPKKFIK
jgi:hypothetical protein